MHQCDTYSLLDWSEPGSLSLSSESLNVLCNTSSSSSSRLTSSALRARKHCTTRSMVNAAGLEWMLRWIMPHTCIVILCLVQHNTVTILCISHLHTCLGSLWQSLPALLLSLLSSNITHFSLSYYWTIDMHFSNSRNFHYAVQMTTWMQQKL